MATPADPTRPKGVDVLTPLFETVAVASPWLVAGTGAFRDLPADASSVLRFPLSSLLGGLEALGSTAARDLLKNAEVVLAGAKEFRKPTGLGDVRSIACYVIELKSSVGFDFTRYPAAKGVTLSPGQNAWEWASRATEGGPSERYFGTALGNNLVLLANDAGVLQKVLHDWKEPRVGETPCRSAYRTKLDLWICRTPREQAAGSVPVADSVPGADAILFQFSAHDRFATLLVRGSRLEQSTVTKLGRRYLLPPFSRIGSSVWRMAVPLTSGDETVERLVAIMGLFGFGLYL